MVTKYYTGVEPSLNVSFQGGKGVISVTRDRTQLATPEIP